MILGPTSDGAKRCPQCLAETPQWRNPYLEALQAAGLHTGSVFGGYVLCDGCNPGVEAALAAKLTPDKVQVPGIPRSFAMTRLTQFIARPGNTTAIATAKSFLGEDASDAYFHGPPGVGKTMLACALANECFHRQWSVRFVRVPAFVLKCQEAIASPDVLASLEPYWTSGLVVLDDVGAERATDDKSDYGRRMLQTLYDARLDEGLRTIWTSNKSLTELAAHYGQDDRLTSRIIGAAYVAEMGGEDWRRQTPRVAKRGRRPEVN